MEPHSVLFKISSVIFMCQKYVKKGYMEIYLETLKVSWVAPFYTT